MNDSEKKKYIDFLISENALEFGEFTLKSGRVSPYFLNMRILSGGRQSYQLGMFYAQKIYKEWGDNFDVVFGPAYAGIPLAVSTVIALEQKYHCNKQYLTNRKEKKEYADKSALLGAVLKGGERILLVDDVLTTGETKEEAVMVLRETFGATITGLVVGLDRLEKGEAKDSALQDFFNKTGIQIESLATINDVLAYIALPSVMKKFGIPEGFAESIDMYLTRFGV
jgi:orotate phosphoribosyltransferase